MDEKEKEGSEQQDSRAHVFSTSQNWRVPPRATACGETRDGVKTLVPDFPSPFGSAVERDIASGRVGKEIMLCNKISMRHGALTLSFSR